MLGEQRRDAADGATGPGVGATRSLIRGQAERSEQDGTPLRRQVSTVQGSTGTTQLGGALPRSRETGGPHHPQRLLLCLSWGERGDSTGQVSWVPGTGW